MNKKKPSTKTGRVTLTVAELNDLIYATNVAKRHAETFIHTVCNDNSEDSLVLKKFYTDDTVRMDKLEQRLKAKLYSLV